jgi:phosphate transport system permease protein
LNLRGIERMHARRRLVNQMMMGFAVLSTAFGVSVLIWVLWDLIGHGLRHLTPALFVLDTPGPDRDGGGLRNALVGSLLLTFWCMVFAVPIGVLAGTWLSEYGKGSALANIIRFVNQVLLSAPSIVLGVFLYAVMVHPSGIFTLRGFSGWAGACALALIALPKIVVATENVLNLVPDEMREAAFALGAPKSRVILDVTYRVAISGITTGLLLAFAQVIGETAPLLFTALGNQFFSVAMSGPMAALPPVIYSFALSPYDRWKELAWAGALLITFGVLGLNILVRSLVRASKT